ncbi:uncharacterized protein LOC135438087 [Drosophila montana]|uniref:uncharacterized protein LOC135438087 n=1 Tax=Drosophila montana TaxID=40370 RepID=UPI00313F339E
MQLEKDSLLYCAYAIAVFDLLCGVLFAALSLCKIFTHLSWLTIFAVCFGLFWLTLIVMLFTGIYRRKSDLVRYWLIFSCVGIFVETCLIIYAFLSESTFQMGLASNSLVLCLGLFVETIFAFVIYQFYQVVATCNPCAQQTYTPPCQAPQPQPPPPPSPKPKPQPEPQVCPASTHKSSHSYRCNILQTRDYNSPYTCGPKRGVHKPFKLDERRSQR